MKKFDGYNFLVSIVYFVFSFAEIILSLRFILKLFGANNDVIFVNWIYEVSQPLLYPFVGIFPAPVVDGLFVIEFTVLFAILVYELIKYLILQALSSIEKPFIDKK